MTTRILLLAALAGSLSLGACAPPPPANPAPAAPSAPAQVQTWKRLYVFGDSYSDIGFGYLDGDGPTAVAYLADHLGSPMSHTKARGWAGKSLNFAVSGARTDANGERDARFGYGLGLQAQEFADLVAAGKIAFDPDHTLFFIAGGLNDARLANEVTEANLVRVATILKGAGAKHFRIAILPEKIPGFGRTGQRLNPTLSALPAKLRAELGVEAQTSRWGAYYDEVLENPAAHGITNTTDACAERALSGPRPRSCARPDQHYFYHEGHPSTAVQKAVGRRLHEELGGQGAAPLARTLTLADPLE